jgi:2-polyprenyl-3-methyl-5-hydroxy-6-metoxy-1,4-benzoquinol methylase
MDQTQEIDVERIMERIKDTIRKRRLESSVTESAPLAHNEQMLTDLAALHNSYDIYHVHFTSHRKILGWLVVSLKKVWRMLLTPILERQVAYNAMNSRVASALWEHLERVSQQQTAALQALQGELERQQAIQRDLFRQQATVLQGLQREFQTLGSEWQAHRMGISSEWQAHRMGISSEWQAHRTGVSEQLHHLKDEFTTGLHDLSTRLKDEFTTGVHDLSTCFDDLSIRFNDLATGFTARDARTATLDRTISQLKTSLMLQERRVTMLLEEARKRLPEPLDHKQIQNMTEEQSHILDALYVSFEDLFRGTREEIKARLHVYLPLIKEAKTDTDRMPIVDLGCGRGEWLEVLQEEGMRARGVDRNRVLLEECRQRGLEVVESDVLAYLQSLPEMSLGAVTGFHIVEHLPFEVMIALLDETMRVLKPGGMAIFETPNPENVLVGTYAFYLDPTHRNPLPSPMMKFLAEARGLCRVEILNLHPQPEAVRVAENGLDVAKRFNDHFYGPQDYAIVGWKARA